MAAFKAASGADVPVFSGCLGVPICRSTNNLKIFLTVFARFCTPDLSGFEVGYF
ncbi:hypothetical protein [Microbulbifer aggregans]|uniref:hypothetical protein n=1 Tax=Microbulbifer aggregans TaxID=1769779 RepID=UPI001CFE9683|nr:hypothetical protein [Microbulbifer aggregans]